MRIADENAVASEKYASRDFFVQQPIRTEALPRLAMDGHIQLLSGTATQQALTPASEPEMLSQATIPLSRKKWRTQSIADF